MHLNEDEINRLTVQLPLSDALAVSSGATVSVLTDENAGIDLGDYTALQCRVIAERLSYWAERFRRESDPLHRENRPVAGP